MARIDVADGEGLERERLLMMQPGFYLLPEGAGLTSG